MNTATTEPTSIPALRRLALILVPVGAGTILTDFLFWGSEAGISVGIVILLYYTIVTPVPEKVAAPKAEK